MSYLGQQKQSQMCIEEHATQEGSYGPLTPMLTGPSRSRRLEKGLDLGQCVALGLYNQALPNVVVVEYG